MSPFFIVMSCAVRLWMHKSGEWDIIDNVDMTAEIKLLKCTSLGDIQVTVEPHKSLNSSREAIF